MSGKTVFVLNPNAAGGRARQVFGKVENQLRDRWGEYTLIETQTPDEVAEKLDQQTLHDVSHLIAVGGDGTNYAVVNALNDRARLDIVFGCLPVGTGSDWARCLGIPGDPSAAADWLGSANPLPCDLGRIEFSETEDGRRKKRLFLNIASAGISGEVDRRVNQARRRSSFTFLRATVVSLLRYKTQHITVTCGGKAFYEGPSYLLAVANGCYFGRGMWVAPHARVDDGLFDVILVEGMPRRRIILALQTVFSGKHLKRDDVHFTRASSVSVQSEDDPLGLDLDGEEARGLDLRFSMMPGALRILMNPQETIKIGGE